MSKKKVVKKEESKQLGLDIKEPFKNRFFKVKGNVDSKMRQMEVRRFFREPFLWLALVIGIILILHQVTLILQNIDLLPSYLPIFKFYLASQEQLAEKIYIYIYPIISASVLFLSFLFTVRYYNRERNFTKILLLSSLLCIFAQSIILIDLIS